MIASVIASITILSTLLATPVYAAYYYDTYIDYAGSTTAFAFDLGTHNYVGNDIGAHNIQITAPTRVDYSLFLFVDTFLGINYSQFGSGVKASTTDTGGYYWWNSVSSNVGTRSARLYIERQSSTSFMVY